jgi:spore germination protein GerM
MKKGTVFISKEICTKCLKRSNEGVRTTNFNDYIYGNKSEIEGNVNNIRGQMFKNIY